MGTRSDRREHKGGAVTRQIRALYDEATITVYQAYREDVADAALAAGTFVPPFKLDRMTWIKPSFPWMMYRSGWTTKAGQERVLAVEITRAGFDWALANSCLSRYKPKVYESRKAWAERKARSPVRVQWDPERSLTLDPLPYRAIQVGLSGEAVRRYVEEWIVGIVEVTQKAQAIHALLLSGNETAARALLPEEKTYPLPEEIKALVAAS